MVIVYMLLSIVTVFLVALIFVLSFFGEVYTTSEGVIFMVDGVGGYYKEFLK